MSNSLLCSGGREFDFTSCSGDDHQQERCSPTHEVVDCEPEPFPLLLFQAQKLTKVELNQPLDRVRDLELTMLPQSTC